MEMDRLKQNIQKSVQEDIAISNFRKEIRMDKGKNRKIVYVVLASCAMFVFCVGVAINKLPIKSEDNPIIQAKLEDLQGEKEKGKTEKLETEIYINKIEKTLNDRDVSQALLKKVDATEMMVDLRFRIDVELPNDFEENFSVTGVYIKGEKSKKYDELQHYSFYYKNKEDTRNILLRLGFKDKKPVRDYLFMDVVKKSKIGEVELEITQYEDSYLVIFSHKDVNYDIETNGITQEELVEFLKSLIINSKSYDQMTAEDKEVNEKEPVKGSSTSYPNYYAGRYVDNQGNNVVLLTVDTKENRKQICSLLGITESKTKFEGAKYSYQYLTELQNKISTKMTNKELPFAISSSIMEDKNWIEVQVTTNEERELKKINELDTVGGAISIRYSEEGAAKTDMLKEKD